MFKLLKYDILGNYKKNLMVILALLIADCAAAFLITSPEKYLLKQSLVMLAWLVASIVLFVFAVKNFHSDLAEDKKFLTFSLPVRGSEFLGCRTITTVIWMVLPALASILVAAFIAKNYQPKEFKELISHFNMGNVFTARTGLITAFMDIMDIVKLYLMICISISIASIRFNAKKGSGWVGFLVFVILNIGQSFARNQVTKTFVNSYINIGSKANETLLPGDMMNVANEMFKINAAGLIFDVIVIILLFVITSIVLERKVEFN